VSRGTVYKHLTLVDDWEAYVNDKSRNINRLALIAVEKAVSKGNSMVAMQWLTRTLLAPESSQVTHINGDVHVSQAVQLLPVAASTPSTTITSGTPSSASTAMTTSTTSSPDSTGPTEAAAKPPGSDMSLSLRKNIFDFSEQFVLNLCDELLPKLQATPADGGVLSRAELLQDLRKATRRCLEQEQPGANPEGEQALAGGTPAGVSGALSKAEPTPLRADAGAVR